MFQKASIISPATTSYCQNCGVWVFLYTELEKWCIRR